MKIIVIAGAAHALLASFGQLFGEGVIAWEDASEGYQQGIIAGVSTYFENLELTPEQEHQKWLDTKLADGWVHGEAIDPTPKTHPLLLPFAELPVEHRVKATILYAAVHALKDLPDADEAVAAALAKAAASLPIASAGAPTQVGLVAVKYIGRRPQWHDHLYDTGLYFSAGQTRNLPAGVARTLLRHPDLFERGEDVVVVDQQDDDTSKLLEQGNKQKAKDDERKVDFAVIDQVNQMNDKDALVNFALTRCNLKLAKTKKVETMRTEIIAHINQFGAA